MAGFSPIRRDHVPGQRLVNPVRFLRLAVLWSLLHLPAAVLAQAVPVPAPAIAESAPPLVFQAELPAEAMVEGQRFVLVWRIPHAVVERPDVALGPVAAPLQLLGPPEFRFEEGFDSDGLKRSEAVVRVALRAASAGWVAIPSLDLAFGPEERWQSPPRFVAVAVAGKPGAIPPELQWEVPTGPVYAGQSIMINLDAVRTRTSVMPRSIAVQVAQGFSLKEVPTDRHSEEYQLAGERFLKVPVASWILSPAVPGPLRMPSLTVQFDGYARPTPPFSIDVLPLPGEVLASGAVGAFSRSVSSLDNALVLGQTFVLTESLEGRGNLPFVRLPPPLAEGIEIQGMDEESRMDGSADGFNGVRERHYRLVPARTGAARLFWPEFKVFDPWQGQVVTVPAQSLNFTIQSAAASPAEQDAYPAFASTGYLGKEEAALPWPVWLGLLILVPVLVLVGKRRNARWLVPVAVIALGGLVAITAVARHRSDPDPALLAEARSRVIAAWAEEDPRAFLQQVPEIIGMYPRLPGVWLDAAHAAGLAKMPARAVWCLEQAQAYGLDRAVAGPLLSALRQDLDIGGGDEVSWIPPESVLWPLAIALAFLAALLFRRRRASRHVVAALACTLLACSLVGLVAWTRIQDNRPWAVVGEKGATLRRIPEADASDWVAVGAGSRVSILARHEGFVLFETAYSVKGWARESELLGGPGGWGLLR